MLALRTVTPTPEQLGIISVTRPGVEIIRGAAGSGKTTTALLKLKALIGMFTSRRQREQDETPIRILVLTYNRTLRGYIAALAETQAESSDNVELVVSTFGKWAKDELGDLTIVAEEARTSHLMALSRGINLPWEFLSNELEYVITRFLPDQINEYATARRDGRGNSPRVERPLREQIINQVILPYWQWLQASNHNDWNDLAIMLANRKLPNLFDVIIVDEGQDFSANQIRAIRNQLKDVHSLVIVTDTAQRIYARGFTWQECGLNITPQQSKRLERNYRNTQEIAQFAAPLLEGLTLDDDATLPDFSKCTKHGPKPIVLEGFYNEQVSHALEFLQGIDLVNESVAFLKPKGGNFFRYLKNILDENGIEYLEITREAEWPEGETNIALCTLHSAKGLEFDHVIMLGLSARFLLDGEETEDIEDERHITVRKLLAMGISRARKSVCIGYKLEEIPYIMEYLDSDTYEHIVL